MRTIFYLVLLCIGLSSCVKNNPDPSWLEVNKWTLLNNPNSQYPTGELTHNFTEASVYIDDKIIGIFQVPFKIPILKTGNVNIKLYPTIKNNGISATKKIYPFVDFYELNTTLNANQTTTINPTTSYKYFTQFWIEDFESATIKIEQDPSSHTTLNAGNDPQFLEYGNFYGRVNFNSTDSLWVAYSQDMVLPRGAEVYLEIDYYNTNAVTTGLIAISASEVKNNPYIQLNSQNTNEVRWKKIYIDLMEIISNSKSPADFRLSFQAELDANDINGFVILDNIKVVHF